MKQGFLSDYLKWFSRNYGRLSEDASAYKVAAFSKNQEGKYVLQIAVTGKNAIFKISPEEILADNQMTLGFSKEDIRNITYFACENLKDPKHEVLGQKFIRSLNKFIFKLKHGKTGEEIEKSAEEISADSNLIKALSPEDAHRIGYVTANEQIKSEKLK